MPFVRLSYSKEYFDKYSGFTNIYGKYFPYTSISPLISHLADNKFNSSSYWTGIRKSAYSKALLQNLLSDEYVNVLKTLYCHGNYMVVFANQFFNKRLKPILISNPELYQKLLNDYRVYSKKSLSEKYGYEQLISDFTGLALLELVTDSEKNEIGMVIDDFLHTEKICPICNSVYKVIFFPEWLYKRVNGNTQVCYECPTGIPKKEEIPKIIKDLVDFLGFIPNSGFQVFNNDSFATRVKKEKWVDAFSYVLKLGGEINGSDRIKQKYGSWFKALVAAGILENGQLKTKRGIKCIAKSGNECNSIDEQYIDNYFYELGLKTIKEPRYPYHPELNQKNLLRADWLINSKYVEYFGLKGEINYDIKTKNKIKLCSELGIELIAIYPDDLSDLSRFKEMLIV
jgi:hypothetical protein